MDKKAMEEISENYSEISKNAVRLLTILRMLLGRGTEETGPSKNQ